jgi:RNA-binding protein 26
MKQMRRGGRGSGQDGFGSRGGRGGFQEPAYPLPHAGSPPMPSGFLGMPIAPAGLSFDPNDPMGAMMAMQAMGMPPLPGMAPLPHAGSPNSHPQFGVQTPPTLVRPRKRERCCDYDTQGYCARGDSCPYEHGTDRLIVPGEGKCLDFW